MPATPVTNDSSSVGTAAEFVWHVFKFPGTGLTDKTISTSRTDLRAIAINTGLNANAVEIHDATGKKLVIPASSAATLQPIYYGDGAFDSLVLVFPEAVTGEIAMLIKEF